MSTVTVEELVMRIQIELDKFRSDASQAEGIEKRLRDSLGKTKDAAEGAGQGFSDLGKKVLDSSQAMDSQLGKIAALASRMASLFAVLASANAVQKFTTTIAKANDQLGFLEQRLGMAARNVRALETAFGALGGGDGAAGTIRSLNQGIQEMVLMGNDALIPFFGALGVGVVDATGSIREMDAILLDMADSLSRMNPQQAYALASAMGLDDSVANTLIQGRDAMQEMLDMHRGVYVATEAEIRASRELGRAQTYLTAQWEGLKSMIAGALVPVLLKMTKTVSGWLDYLARNERTVKNFFEGLAIAIGVMLIPVLLKAAIGMAALIAPIAGATAAVALLAAGFGLLYDDYKTWAAGGKSLFDWKAFDQYIRNADISVDSLSKGFARLLTGYDSLTEASRAFSEWLRDTGIIDQHGLSIDGLARAFRGLGQDVLSGIPALRTLLEIVTAVTEGRWGDALSLAKGVPTQMLGTLIDVGAGAAARAGSAIDTALGGGSTALGDAARSAGAWAKGKLGVGSSSGMLATGKAAVIERVAAQIGLKPNDLAHIISFETGGTFDPAIRNPRSSATGLIQKMADPDGKYYGYTRDELGSMSFEEQMEKVVLRYFRERGFSADRKRTLAEGYEAVSGSGYRRGSQAYELNKVWDANGDGVIDRNEAVNAPQFQAHAKDWMAIHRAAGMTGSPVTQISSRSSSAGAQGVQVTVGTVNVQTSAQTLPAATADGVAAGVARGADLINQLGGGIQ